MYYIQDSIKKVSLKEKMPIYIYKVKEGLRGCKFCREGFEILQRINDAPLKRCPECGEEVVRVLSNFSVGFSQTTLDRKAKEKGFHKLKKVDKGKYEKLY
ncbi:MAG: zinc ribbon domain-containing protein [Candidatus Omnitrophota bacterium]|nr:MAG: zinc ribbon domain-containing protein [Candidatus Omnitrophota bacterium]